MRIGVEMRRTILLIVTSVALFVSGMLAGWLVLPIRATRSIQPTLRVGETVRVSGDGGAFGFKESGGEGRGAPYSSSGAQFFHGYRGSQNVGTWSEESCLVPASYGQRVEIAVIRISAEDGPGGEKVVWIKCLSEPKGTL